MFVADLLLSQLEHFAQLTPRPSDSHILRDQVLLVFIRLNVVLFVVECVMVWRWWNV